MERNHVSLESAKRLKTAGFPQKSYSFWYDDSGPGRAFLADSDYVYLGLEEWHRIAAPTAQEVADELPNELQPEIVNGLRQFKTFYMHHEGPWEAGYEVFGYVEAETMVEALALLWLKISSI